MSNDLTRPLLLGQEASPLQSFDSLSSENYEHSISFRSIRRYRLLSSDDLDETEINGHVEKMISILGYDVVNQNLFPEGMTLFLRLVKDANFDPVESILTYASKNGKVVALKTCKVKDTPVKNALQIAMEGRSPELVQLLLKFFSKGVANPEELSEVYSESLCHLLEKQELDCYLRFGHMTLSFRTIFGETISDRSFLVTLGEVYVPDTIFASSRDPFIVGLHNECRPRNGKGLWNLWREMNPQMAQYSDEDYDRSIKIRARAFLVPIKGIAQPGHDGLLEPILLMDCQDKVFKSLPVIALIKWKWEKYAFKLANIQMMKCIVLLITFSTYSLLFMNRIHHPASDHPEHLISMLSIASAVSAWILLWSEMCQFGTYVLDGTKYRHRQFSFLSRSAGMHYWLFAKWNIMELTSFVLVGIVLPLLYFLFDFNSLDWHSWLVGLTGILLWWKMLYYLQLFERTSPLVAMIFDIAIDMLAFVAIAVFLLVGFALGFIVLFHQEDGKIHSQFSTLPRSCVTLFAYLLGAFDVDDFASTKYPNLAYAIFVVYEITMTIVLLNLLIAIMGDNYDRIKEKETTTFLMSKAAVIEDMETMNRRKLRKMDIPQYMHILVPSHNCRGDGDPWWAPVNEGVWQGRMVHLERKIRCLICESDKKTKQEILDASSSLNKKMEELQGGGGGGADDYSSDRASVTETPEDSFDDEPNLKNLQHNLQTNFDDIRDMIETRLDQVASSINVDVAQGRKSLILKRKNQDQAAGSDELVDTAMENLIEKAVVRNCATLDKKIARLESGANRKLDEIGALVNSKLRVMQENIVGMGEVVEAIVRKYSKPPK